MCLVKDSLTLFFLFACIYMSCRHLRDEYHSIFSPFFILYTKDWVQQEAHDVTEFFPTLRIVGRSGIVVKQKKLNGARKDSTTAPFSSSNTRSFLPYSSLPSYFGF